MDNNFYCLCLDKEIDDGASIIEHEDLPFKDYQFDEATSLIEHFREPVAFFMDKDRESARVCYDYLDNVWSIFMISERMMSILKSFDCGEVEFLPIKIFDQRNKPIKELYYIVNTLESIDYIDENNSELEYNRIMPDQIDDIDKLVLEAKRIPDSRDLFRTNKFSSVHIVSEQLKDKLEELGMEGIVYIPTDEFESIEHL